MSLFPRSTWAPTIVKRDVSDEERDSHGRFAKEDNDASSATSIANEVATFNDAKKLSELPASSQQLVRDGKAFSESVYGPTLTRAEVSIASEKYQEVLASQGFPTVEQRPKYNGEYELALTRQNITDSLQQKALTTYTGAHHLTINSNLREGRAPDASDLRRDAALQLASRTRTEPIIVCRLSSIQGLGFGGNSAQEAAGIVLESLDKLAPGCILEDKAYTSTTVRQAARVYTAVDTGAKSVDLQSKQARILLQRAATLGGGVRIRATRFFTTVMPGAPGAFISPISDFSREDEFLLGRNVKRVIQSVSLVSTSDTHWEIHVHDVAIPSPDNALPSSSRVPGADTSTPPTGDTRAPSGDYAKQKVTNLQSGDVIVFGKHGEIKVSSIAQDPKNENYVKVKGTKTSDGKSVSFAASKNKSYDTLKASVAKLRLANVVKYSPDQPRDSHGRFGSNNSESSLESSTSKKKIDQMSVGDTITHGSHGRITIKEIKPDKSDNYRRVVGIRESDGKKVTIAVSRNKEYEHTPGDGRNPAPTPTPSVTTPPTAATTTATSGERTSTVTKEETAALAQKLEAAQKEYNDLMSQLPGTGITMTGLHNTPEEEAIRARLVEVTKTLGSAVTAFIDAKVDSIQEAGSFTPKITREMIGEEEKKASDARVASNRIRSEANDLSTRLADEYQDDVLNTTNSIVADAMRSGGFPQETIDAFLRQNEGSDRVLTILGSNLPPSTSSLLDSSDSVTSPNAVNFVVETHSDPSTGVYGKQVYICNADNSIKIPLEEVFKGKEEELARLGIGVLKTRTGVGSETKAYSISYYNPRYLRTDLMRKFFGATGSASRFNEMPKEFQARFATQVKQLATAYKKSETDVAQAIRSYTDMYARIQSEQLRSTVTFDTLRSLREFADGKTLQVATGQIIGGNKKSREDIAGLFTSASTRLPADWVRLANERQMLGVNVRASGRAFYSPMRREITLYLSDAKRQLSTVLHESTHHMEKTVPGLAILEKGYWEQRCPERHKSKNVGGGEGDPDTFPEPYSGRVYDGFGSWEIATVGMEGMLASQQTGGYLDKDYRDFMSGLLLLVGKTSNA